jgi:hypothetical protein
LQFEDQDHHSPEDCVLFDKFSTRQPFVGSQLRRVRLRNIPVPLTQSVPGEPSPAMKAEVQALGDLFLFWAQVRSAPPVDQSDRAAVETAQSAQVAVERAHSRRLEAGLGHSRDRQSAQIPI